MYVKTMNYISNIYDLKELCWSGALQRIDEIIENNLEDEFMEYLQEIFSCDIEPEDTDINDFVWFECDEWIEEHKEEKESEDNK